MFSRFLFLFLFLTQFIIAQKKALIIAVGEYPSKTGWSSISSVNDVPLIQDALLKQGFSENNVAVIMNEAATKDGILTAIKKLYDDSEKGDIVVIHYSGHGQQIFDDNGDEADGLDESLVPYDAFAKYTHNYKGQNHIRDDEIEQIINNFRNKLGPDGQLLMIFDSCHSGSASRGGKARGGVGALLPSDWNPQQIVKNNTAASGMFDTVKLADNSASFVLISGASAEELNYEYQGMGSLSYAFSKAMSQLGKDFSYRQLFANIASEMQIISPKQSPAIEGDLDYKLFKGEYKAQQPYFPVKRVARLDVVQIPAGKLQQIFVGTTVFILPSGTTEVNAKQILAKGEVTLSRYNEAVIKLDKPLADTNSQNYWVFIDQPTFGDIAVKVFIDSSADQNDVVTSISSFLDQNKLGEIVKIQEDSDITIKRQNGELDINVTNDLVVVESSEASRGQNQLDDLNQKIFQFAQGKYLKGLQMKNLDYEFSFRLLPVEFDETIEEVGETKAIELDANQIFKVKPEEDYVLLEVTNKSNKPIYFSIVEINTKGEVNSFMPNDYCDLNDQERMIPAGQTVVFKRCVFSFGPPYEKLMLKGFASPTPLNFQTTVDTRGQGTRGANSNPLEKFLQQSYQTTRGSGGNKVSEKIDAYSYEFVYEIVE